MTKQIKRHNKDVWICEACGFAYKEKDLAQKCEDWCKKHNSCNIEITKNAIKM